MATNENLIPIPGRLHSVAVEGHVSGADEIFDDSFNKDQATINQEVNEALGTGGSVDSRIAAAINALDASASQTAALSNGNLNLSVTETNGKVTAISGSIDDAAYIDDTESSPAVVPGFDPTTDTVHITAQVLSESQKAQVRTNIGLGDVDAKINEAVASEASQRAAGDSSLQSNINNVTSNVNSRLNTQDQKIALLNGAEVIVVEDHTQVSSPDPQKIYREIGTSSYTDWMNQTGNANDWKAIATYTPGIEDVPTAGSINLVKSGGVAESIDPYLGFSYKKKGLRGSAGNIELDFVNKYKKDQEFSVIINQSDSSNTAVQLFVSNDGGASWAIGYTITAGLLNDNGFSFKINDAANLIRIRKQSGATVFEATLSSDGEIKKIIDEQIAELNIKDEEIEGSIDDLKEDIFGGSKQKSGSRESAGDIALDFAGNFIKEQKFSVTIDQSDSSTTTVQLFTSNDGGASWTVDYIVISGLLNDNGFSFTLTEDANIIRIRKQSGATIFIATLSSEGIVETLEKLGDEGKLDIRMLVIGDSYSVDGSPWITPLMEKFSSQSSFVSLAVGSASVKDKYADRTQYPYTSRPVASDLSGNLNTFACQIEKLDRLMAGVDLDPGETPIYQTTDSYPNIIIIEGGMNDVEDNDNVQQTYLSQFQKRLDNVYIKSKMTGEISLGTWYELTPVEEVNRLCFGGAYRYLIESLQTRFPNAQIFITTASMLGYWTSDVVNRRRKTAEQQRICANYAGASIIDWNQNGQISIINNHGVGGGTQEDPYLSQVPSGLDTNDTMHPNSHGGKKLASVAYHAIVSNFMNIIDF